MSSNDPRPPPQSTIQAAGRVAEDVVGGLQKAPIMLGVIVLNVILVGAALYFLSTLSENARKHREDLMAQNAKQFEELMRLCTSRDYRLQSDDDATK